MTQDRPVIVMSDRDDATLGFFDNSLANWPNDDLMLEQRQRDYIAAVHPDVFPLLDWPAVRDWFVRHDLSAGQFRDRTRRAGLIAVLLGFASMVLAAATPLIAHWPGIETDDTSRALGVVIAALATLSGGIAFGLLLFGRSRRRWLTHRFRTERTRQFYFQFLLNNLDLAGDILSGRQVIAVWRERQDKAFLSFTHAYLGDLDDAMGRMEGDVAEQCPWIEPVGPRSEAACQTDPAVAPLLQVLHAQRIQYQQRYTSKKLRRGAHSPVSRRNAAKLASDVLTVAAMVGALVTGILYFSGNGPDDQAILWSAGLVALVSAAIVVIRAISDGLQLAADAERFEWYAASVDSVAARFDRAGLAERVELLRELEHLSYQELRRFILTFLKARFVL